MELSENIILIIIVTSVATFISRFLGVLTAEKINEKSLDAFFSLGCTGYGRVDFMIDDKKELFFIEVNTIPGFTDHSLMPMSAKAIGKNFDDLVLDVLGETFD